MKILAREGVPLFMRSRQSFITSKSRWRLNTVVRVVDREPSGDAYRSRKAPRAALLLLFLLARPPHFVTDLFRSIGTSPPLSLSFSNGSDNDVISIETLLCVTKHEGKSENTVLKTLANIFIYV